jgi:SAM-dependent methyltransferase
VIQQSQPEQVRDEYRRLRPQWKDSRTLYRDMVWHNLPLGGSTIDLGVGDPDLLGKELTRAGLSIGVDPSRRARREKIPGMERLVAQANRLPFGDGEFDLVTMAWLLERLHNPPAVLREARRVLRRGGHLVFITANAWSINVWMERFLPKPLADLRPGRRQSYPFPYRLYSPLQIEQMLTLTGFKKGELLENGDPNFAGITPPMSRLTQRIEQLLDRDSLRLARAHLLGIYEK